jgi:hypothetical protein
MAARAVARGPDLCRNLWHSIIRVSRSLNGGCMSLRPCDVQCDPIADRALKELAHRYTVAEEKSGLVLTEKTWNMKGTDLPALPLLEQ